MPRHATGLKRKPDPHATVVVFKVALTGDKTIWRRIAIRSDQTLDDLHAAIFDAYDRFDEHLYSFHLQPLYARRGPDFNRGNVEYTSPVHIEEARSYAEHKIHDAAKTRIADLSPQPGDKLYYLFDFGDSWWHELTVEQTDGKMQYGRAYPFIMEKHGVSPPQYPEPEEAEGFAE